MRHSEWFQREAHSKGKRVEVIKNGIKTYEWVSNPEPAIVIDKDEHEVEEPIMESKSAAPKGRFHKGFCNLCQRNTWHYKGAGANDKAHCTDHSDWPSKIGRSTLAVKDAIIVTAQLTPIHETPTEGTVRAMNKLNKSLWRNASDRIARYYGDDEWLTGGNDVQETQAPDPDKHYCSFCGNETAQIKLTTEKRPKLKKVIETSLDADNNVVITEKAVVGTETVHACPNCIVNIRKPIVVRRV